MTDETKTQPADLAATMLHEKQEVIYALMKENAQLRESSARVKLAEIRSQQTVKILTAERDEARAEAAKLSIEVDQLKVYGQGMTEECKKLREERDAALTLDEIRTAITEACEPCGGKGGIETTGYSHECGGDERLCQSLCPVQVQEYEQCKYCGRPIAAVEQFAERRREEKGGE